jgi:hypothetical protein
MKYILTLIITITSSFCGFAQTSFSNSIFYYGYTPNAPWENYATQIKAQNDTTINGKAYTGFDHNPGIEPIRIYVRTENNILYFYFRNKEFTLFDFNASVNDTITLDILSDYTESDTTLIFENEKVIIKNIYYTQNPVKGDSLKRFVYEFVDLSRTESSGLTESVLSEAKHTGNIFSLIDDRPNIMNWYTLRCYESDSLNYKDSAFYQSQKPCDYSNVGLKEVAAAQKITISPNPATTSIILPQNNYQTLNIYNHLGQLVLTLKHPSITIDISILETGLFYIQAISEESISYANFIKK